MFRSYNVKVCAQVSEIPLPYSSRIGRQPDLHEARRVHCEPNVLGGRSVSGTGGPTFVGPSVSKMLQWRVAFKNKLRPTY